MTRRQVVIDALQFRTPVYVPWAWAPTLQCADRLKPDLARRGLGDLPQFVGRHFLDVTSTLARFESVGPGRVRDLYGVTWDRSVDHDIGVTIDWPIRRPEDLDTYAWPDSDDAHWYAGLASDLATGRNLFRRYMLGFSLYERAWTMRGMSDLLMDMVERPAFVERLLDRITEHNLGQIRKAVSLDIDAVYFGDDYGMQTGLIMGLAHWRRFIKPRLARMFAPVCEAGKFVMMHSCGCVAELFDDLIEIGLNCFNPFQPEVMDVFAIKRRYHGRLAFHGGLSIQRTLPFGTAAEVRRETQRLIEAGRAGGYIFSPSHAVPPDVPPENLVAMMETLRAQPGAPA